MNVAVYQPVIPQYRVSFFNALESRPEIKLTLFAALEVEGAPETVIEGLHPNLNLLGHKSLFWGMAVWQVGAKIPKNFHKGDVLVLCGNPRYISNYKLLIEAKRRGIGVVWWGLWNNPGSSVWAIKIRIILMSRFNSVLVYHESERSDLIELGLNKDRVHSINNTIDTSEIPPEISEIERDDYDKAMEELSWHQKYMLLYCGRLTKKPQLDILMQAVFILKEKNHQVALAIIGDGPERNSLERQVEMLGLTKNVYFLGSIYEERRLAPWFINAKVFVYPGAIGLSIFHASAYNLPVITHNCVRHQAPEYAALIDGVTGLTFGRSNSSELADRILQFVSTSGLSRELGANANKYIREEYSIQLMADRFITSVRASVV